MCIRTMGCVAATLVNVDRKMNGKVVNNGKLESVNTKTRELHEIIGLLFGQRKPTVDFRMYVLSCRVMNHSGARIPNGT